MDPGGFHGKSDGGRGRGRISWVASERPRPRAGCGSGRRFRGSRPRGPRPPSWGWEGISPDFTSAQRRGRSNPRAWRAATGAWIRHEPMARRPRGARAWLAAASVALLRQQQQAVGVTSEVVCALPASPHPEAAANNDGGRCRDGPECAVAADSGLRWSPVRQPVPSGVITRGTLTTAVFG